ncbi:MAG: hypothetical protein KUG82_03985 [Pseudomonadales bacterium]|nr:hypothetical protein [Pseudomonadales bacterium]
MTKRLSVNSIFYLLFISLVPLSSLVLIVGNFSLLDLVIVLYTVAWRIKLNGEYTASLTYQLSLITVTIAVFTIILVYGVTEEAVKSLSQLIFILFFVPLFIQCFFDKVSLDKFLNSISILSMLLSFAIIISPIISHPFVKFDLVARYQPTTSGTTAIYIIAFSYVSYLFYQRKLAFLYFSAYLLFTFLAIYLTGQRSLLLGFFLILTPVIIKRGAIVGLGFLFLIIIQRLYVSFDFSSSRLTENLINDASRVQIVIEFFQSISTEPINIFVGWGVGVWSSAINSQEPHNNFLHLISDYGVYVAISYSMIVYCFAMAFLQPSVTNNRLLYIMITLGLIPYYMAHTYSLERGNILLFMVISFYFLKGKTAQCVE